MGHRDRRRVQENRASRSNEKMFSACNLAERHFGEQLAFELKRRLLGRQQNPAAGLPAMPAKAARIFRETA